MAPAHVAWTGGSNAVTMTLDTEIESSTRALCTFWLGGLLFGIDVLRTQEVLRASTRHRVGVEPG